MVGDRAEYFVPHFIFKMLFESCIVRGFGYLSLSLGVTTLHVTPVMLPCMVRCYCNGGGSLPLLGMPTTVSKTSSHRILNISCRNPVVGISTDDLL